MNGILTITLTGWRITVEKNMGEMTLDDLLQMIPPLPCGAIEAALAVTEIRTHVEEVRVLIVRLRNQTML